WSARLNVASVIRRNGCSRVLLIPKGSEGTQAGWGLPCSLPHPNGGGPLAGHGAEDTPLGASDVELLGLPAFGRVRFSQSVAARRRGRTVRILVIGASGLIGSAVCARLAADRHEVIGVCRHPPAAGLGDVGHLALDLASAVPADFVPLLAGIDAVVNCA